MRPTTTRAIFSEEQRDTSIELAFKYAVYKINKDRSILPKTTLVYDIQYVPDSTDSFRTSKKVCKQIENGVTAIFGPPSDPLLSPHIQSICEALDIPHLETRFDIDTGAKEFSINLYPQQQKLNEAILETVKYLNWTRYAIIYEGVFKQQDLMKSSERGMEVYIRQALPETYRLVLREIRQKEIYKLIIDTSPQNINKFFRTILQLQMNDFRYHYMFTTFDIETFDLEDFKYNSVNITAFRLVDVESPKVMDIMEKMKKFQPNAKDASNGTSVIMSDSALMFDAVTVYAHGLSELDSGHKLKLVNLSCDSEIPWNDGLSLFNYIDSVSLTGLTGKIEFNEGKRVNFKLDLLKLKREELLKVGQWTSENGLEIKDPNAFYESNNTRITLTVMTREEKPYLMLKEGNFTGNDRFEGFCIDLLKGIGQQVGFQYTIRLVPDNMYGVYNPETKSWNGIGKRKTISNKQKALNFCYLLTTTVRELIERRSDLAVASMTINYARENVIDFTKPFMNLGIGILFKVPTSQPTRLFSFMNPLAIEIWLYVLAAYTLVSFTLFVMARFSPYEWAKNFCHQEQVVENQFSVSNRQSSGLNPKATSTRIVGGIWWFFTLIIISSYTANLAAFLTVERMITPIENAADLADQQDISYGTLEGGSTMTFFRSKKPSVFVATYEDGIKRVLEGDYAFLMESTMLDFAVQRDCNLTQIGGYGIATPKGSIWRDRISLAILELQEKGTIQILYDKWWKNTGEICSRDEKNKESKANALGVENIGGVFVVLLCGLAFAILVAILEFCWNSKKNAQNDRQSLCSEMAEELRFAVRCHGSRQRPALKRNCTKCSPGAHTYVPSTFNLPPPHHYGRIPSPSPGSGSSAIVTPVVSSTTIATATAAAGAINNHNSNFVFTSPLHTHHNSLHRLKNGERMILFRNNSLKRSFKKINNEVLYTNPHHCTIELKTKASSCLHLFNKSPPVTLTTFSRGNHSNGDDQQKNNEILWRYQYDISKAKTSHSQCNLNNIHCHNYNANNMIMTETKFNNSLENKTIL
ncbi:CLUMA_CG009342, isoform A [Clunio marinus]|uniref:CLUMA_CG009342, isoform A n=1 Tax=Clunio marinus TaxID=568069 RepID=A0A1J1I6K8_9DIPT|nr:CLUMA_CG009342, isoform A [Clunio marinus]